MDAMDAVVAFLLFSIIPPFHRSTFGPPRAHQSDDGKTSDGYGSAHPRTCTRYIESSSIMARVDHARQLRELSIDFMSTFAWTLLDDLVLGTECISNGDSKRNPV